MIALNVQNTMPIKLIPGSMKVTMATLYASNPKEASISSRLIIGDVKLATSVLFIVKLRFEFFYLVHVFLRGGFSKIGFQNF